jgi:hypothetical protein
MPEAEPSGVVAWQVVYIKPLLTGPGCVVLVDVDVDELQHALGGIVLEAAYMERVLRTAFSALVGSKYAAVVDGRLTAAALSRTANGSPGITPPSRNRRRRRPYGRRSEPAMGRTGTATG